jgi:hypothetical protein
VEVEVVTSEQALVDRTLLVLEVAEALITAEHQEELDSHIHQAQLLEVAELVMGRS